jgi:hypothetical protein
MLSLSYKVSADAEQFVVEDSQTRTIKIYHPMPYHANTSSNSDVSELYQEGDKFYHVVEQSFQNDTFYIKIQDNINARDRFFALGDAVKDLSFDKENQSNSKDNHQSTLTLDDLSKVFSPPSAPQLIRGITQTLVSKTILNSEYCVTPQRIALAIPTPPPNFSI